MNRRTLATTLLAIATMAILAGSFATSVLAAPRIVPLAAGAFHTCALTPSGGAMCWGSGGDGTLGNGAPPGGFPSDSNVPVAVSGLGSGLAAIASGSYHTCAVTTGGAASCWGDNSRGQLGDNSMTTRYSPVPVVGLGSGVAEIVGGGFHTCALMETTGGVKCWGSNIDGQLGLGTLTPSMTPVDVPGLTSGVAAIAAGYRHTCAVLTTHAVMCWGDNFDGEVGDGTEIDRLVPTLVPGVAATAIATGDSHTCALTTAGGVMCWGENGYGELGDGTFEQRDVPVDVPALTSGVTQISTHGIHTCALTTAGTVDCWGENGRGQVGDGTNNSRGEPVQVLNLSNVVEISAGYYHSCALTTSGVVKCWGFNLYGELGNGLNVNSNVPVEVLGAFASGLTRPANDDFANAATLTGATGPVTVHLFDATRETDEPTSCQDRGSVWYTWTPDQNGFAYLEVAACVVVYSGGSLSTLAPVPSELLPTQQSPYRAGFAARAGQTYHIAVAGDASSPDASVTLFRKFWPSPANDDFDHAQVLNGTTGSVTGTTEGATHELGEPGECSFPFSGSVWYQWTAGDAGLLSLRYSSDACVAAYTGTSVGTLTPVAGEAGPPVPFTAETLYRVVPGTTYRFKVTTFFEPGFTLHRLFTADESVEVLAAPGGAATTDDERDGAWPDDPIEVTVTTPNAGTISITETRRRFTTFVGPFGADIDLGFVADISAPPATAEEPLRIEFRMDASVMPRDPIFSYRISRNGQFLWPCTAPPSASPDPCLLSDTTVGDDSILTVLTSHASAWTFTLGSTLSIQHVIVNDDGGTLTCGDFSFAVSDYQAPADEDCLTTLSVPSGTYTISQPAIGGYTTTYSNCSNIVLTTTGTATCTITNDDQPSGFAFSGFFAPVDNAPVLNAVKGGQAVPVEFSLGGNRGLDVFASGYPLSQQMSCDTAAPIDDVEQTVAAGASSLSYDTSTDRYTYVWKTTKAWVGTCRRLVLHFTDGSEHGALFKFK